MNTASRSILSAGLVALGLAAAQAASAQVATVYDGANGPVVLDVDPAGIPIVPPSRPDLAVPAIPVPQVMNGGGFGITGFNYYDDGPMEGRGAPRGKRKYVLAPAWITGPAPR